MLTFQLDDPEFDGEAFARAVIGPSGNLRAPTLRVGKTFFVGFSAEAYGDKIG